MEVFRGQNVSIVYDSELCQLRQTWIDFVDSENFRKAIDETVVFAQQNVVKSIVSDALKQRAVTPDDSTYAASVMPDLYQAGVEAMAFVIPENIFTKMALRKFAGVENANIQLQFFSNIEEALLWLKTTVVN